MLTFDGVDDYVTIPDPAGTFSNVTVEAWIKVDPSIGDYTNIINKASGNDQDFVLQIKSGSSRNLRFFSYIASPVTTNFDITSGNYVFEFNRWTHVAAVFNDANNVAKIYVNGVEVASGAANNAMYNTSNTIRLANASGYPYFYKGSLDEVRIWDAAKTQAQIQAGMYTPLVGNESGLTAYYNFDAATGSALDDQTSNANNGTLTSMSNVWSESYALVAPVASSASNVAGTSFTANWSAPATGVADSYYLEVSTNSTFTSLVSGYNPKIVGNVLSTSVTGLNPATNYYYRVRAYKTATGDVGTYSGVISVTTSQTSQTITFNALPSKVYGASNFAPGATASSNLTVIYTSSDHNVATIVSNQIHIVGQGTCTIYADQAGNSSYSAAPQVGRSFTVSRAPLTVTAAAKTKVYGESDPTLTYSITGYVNGENASVLTTPVSISRASGENFGTYTITPSGAAAANYSFGYTTASFSITKASVTVTTNSGQSKYYGESDPIFTYSSNPALVPGNSFSGSLERAAGESVGNYAINIGTLSAGNNYNITFNSANFTINTALPPTITSFLPVSATAGETVTITGTNFYNVTDVSFGGTAAASFNVISATSIQAVVGTGTTGSVSVTAMGGTAELAGFTYNTVGMTTFTGTGNWEDASHWSNGVPVAAFNAIIDGHCYLGYSNPLPESKNLTINPSKSLILDYNGELAIHGCLKLLSSSTESGIFINKGQFSHNDLRIQRYINANAWHLFSSPLTSASLQNDGYTLVPAGGHAWLRPYINGTGWGSYITDLSTKFVPTVGYAVFLDAEKTVELQGFLCNYLQDFINIPLLSGNAWNLIGNPYTAYIDWDAVYNSNPGINPSIWIWDQSYGSTAGNYGTYNAAGASSVPAYINNSIAPMQGFFVKYNLTGQITIAKDNLAISGNGFYKSSSNNVFRIKAQKGIYSDELAVYLNPSSTNDMDAFDSEKMFNDNDNVPEIYTLAPSGEKLIINSVASAPVVIPVEVKAITAGDITLTAFGYDNLDASVSVYLEDRELSVSQNLRTNPVYSFTSAAGNNTNRFFLHFGSSTQGIDNNASGSLVAYSSNGNIYINNTSSESVKLVEVYDMLGKQLMKFQPVSVQLLSVPFRAAAGSYIVKISCDKQVKSTKIVIN